MALGSLQWLIPILGGVIGLLMARGVLPRNPETPEQAELAAQWRRKYGRLMTVISPLLIVWGLANLTGVIPQTAPQQRERKIDPATGLPEGLTNHRKEAPLPDDDGWYSARSTEGCFSVRVPIPFVDQTFKEPADPRGAKTYSIQARSFLETFFVAEQTDDEDSSPEAFVKRTKSKHDIGSPRFHDFEGYRSVDTRMNEYGRCSVSRFVQIGPRHTIKMMFSYGQALAEADEIASKFMDSLVINAPKGTDSN